MRARFGSLLMGGVLILGLADARAQAPEAVSPPAAVEASGESGAPQQTNGPTSAPAEGEAAAEATPPSFLAPEKRTPPSEIQAVLTAPGAILDLISAGWLRQDRVAELASSDLRTVRAMVEYARNAPSGTVLDIGAGLQRAARNADRAGSADYGLAIQEIVAGSDVAALNRAYAMAERTIGDIPATAALGGAGGGGATSGGTVSGSSLGAAGGAGGAGGDDVVETRLGSYPVYSGGAISAYDGDDDDSTRFLIVGGTGGGTPASPAD